MLNSWVLIFYLSGSQKDSIFQKSKHLQWLISNFTPPNNLTQQSKIYYFERVKLKSAFKAKLVLELLQNESTLVEIAMETSKDVLYNKF